MNGIELPNIKIGGDATESALRAARLATKFSPEKTTKAVANSGVVLDKSIAIISGTMLGLGGIIGGLATHNYHIKRQSKIRDVTAVLGIGLQYIGVLQSVGIVPKKEKKEKKAAAESEVPAERKTVTPGGGKVVDI